VEIADVLVLLQAEAIDYQQFLFAETAEPLQTGPDYLAQSKTILSFNTGLCIKC